MKINQSLKTKDETINQSVLIGRNLMIIYSILEKCTTNLFHQLKNHLENVLLLIVANEYCVLVCDETWLFHLVLIVLSLNDNGIKIN